MKKVIFLAVLMPFAAFGQVIENFESGNCLNWVQPVDGRWAADTSEPLSGLFSLHHIFDNTSTGSDCVGLPLADFHPGEGTARWSFKIRHGYDPSSTNSWAAYIMSDTGPAAFSNGLAASGYAVGVNLTGYDDTVRLWKIRNGATSSFLACPVNWQTEIGTEAYVTINIERSESGNWSLLLYDNEQNLKGTVSGNDPELFNNSWFILNYRYSSTRDRLLWFDDLSIEGVFYEDRVPPEIAGCEVSGIRSLDITFSEEPSGEIMQTSNFNLAEISNSPSSIIRISKTSIRVMFPDDLENKTLHHLYITSLCDRKGNCRDDVMIEFTPVRAEPGDVIFTEIMADPLPPVSLPAREYIEIFNRTHFTINLEKWNLFIDDQKVVFPAYRIEGGEYLIICSSGDTELFSAYGNTAVMKSLPVLADAGRIVALTDSSGNLIHGIEYTSDWYGDVLKSGGGFSLEMTDTDFPFCYEGNWEASSSAKGGTPGAANSSPRYNPDLSFPGIENIFPSDSLTLNCRFYEPLLFFSERSIEEINPGGIGISYILPSDRLFRRFDIRLSTSLDKATEYIFEIPPDITDFAGNCAERRSLPFGIPEKAVKGDLVFNELLFNPLPDDADYIEFRNNSETVIDASRLFLASVNILTGDTSDIKGLSTEGRCIMPGAYYVITTDRDRVIDRYFVSDPEVIFNIASLPSMPDDMGHLLLLNREMELIDEVIYNEKIHFPLLSGREGISLEKIRPELPSGAAASWHSASESVGWGTPGRGNSVFSQVTVSDDRVVLSSGRISPDNDGYEDVLIIDLTLEGIDNIVTVTLFDEAGGYIRKLKENFLAAGQASLVWDGTAHDGTLVRAGIYIILIELYNDKGKRESWKRVCAVIRS